MAEKRSQEGPAARVDGQAEWRLGFHTSQHSMAKCLLGKGGVCSEDPVALLCHCSTQTPRGSWAPGHQAEAAESLPRATWAPASLRPGGESGRATFGGPASGPLGWRRNGVMGTSPLTTHVNELRAKPVLLGICFARLGTPVGPCAEGLAAET